MPVNKTTSSLLAKYGQQLSKAFEASKADDTDYGSFGSLPAGVQGIARLVDCRFDVYKKGELAGEYFWIARGVVLTPQMHNGVKTAGKYTMIIEPVCPTPGKSRETTEDHMKWINNELRKLGVDTRTMTADQLEQVCAALMQAQPTFGFRTWQGEPTKQYPNHKVNHTWEGIIEYDEDAEDDTKDNTEKLPESPSRGPRGGVKAPPTKSPPVNGVQWARGPADKKSKQPESLGKESFDEFNEPEDEDLDELASAATGGDEAAGNRLTQLATKAGADYEAVQSAESWNDVVDMIRAASNPTEDSSEGGFVPEVEETFHYTPIDPKTKKPGRKVECEVVSVDKEKQTVTLKNLATEALYRNVPWEAIAPEA